MPISVSAVEAPEVSRHSRRGRLPVSIGSAAALATRGARQCRASASGQLGIGAASDARASGDDCVRVPRRLALPMPRVADRGSAERRSVIEVIEVGASITSRPPKCPFSCGAATGSTWSSGSCCVAATVRARSARGSAPIPNSEDHDHEPDPLRRTDCAPTSASVVMQSMSAQTQKATRQRRRDADPVRASSWVAPRRAIDIVTGSPTQGERHGPERRGRPSRPRPTLLEEHKRERPPHRRERRGDRVRHRRELGGRPPGPAGLARHRADRQGPAAEPRRIDRARVELHLPGRSQPGDGARSRSTASASTRRWGSTPPAAASRSRASPNGSRSSGGG